MYSNCGADLTEECKQEFADAITDLLFTQNSTCIFLFHFLVNDRLKMWNAGLELFLTSEAGHAKKRDGCWCRWSLTAKMLILLEINFPVKIFLK